MNRELEYLVRVYTDAVGVRTVKGFVRKASAWVQGNCRRKHWELGIVESVEARDGREPTRKRNKRQDALVENCRKEWECMHIGELQHHQPASSVSHWIKWEC